MTTTRRRIIYGLCLLTGATLLMQCATATRQSETRGVSATGDERSYVGPRTTVDITPQDLRTRLYVFADDSMRGRAGGTVDNLRGTAYIERELRRLGVAPAGENGTYAQDIPLLARRISRNSAITVDGKKFELGIDFVPRDNGLRMNPFDAATAVYGGLWGDTTKLISREAAAGKVVLITLPGGWAIDRGAVSSRYATAAAIAVASMDSMPATSVTEGINLRTLQLDDGTAQERPSFFYVRTGLARAMLGGAMPSTLAVGKSGRIIRGQVTFDSERSPARNVVATIRGSDPSLRGQYIALGAHNDHDPVRSVAVDHDSLRAFNIVARPGGAESRIPQVITEQQQIRIRAILDSLRRLRPARRDSIMNGADDDGSGSMALIEIAEAFSRAKVTPKRSLLFVWHTSEELGLLGSRYYSSHLTVPRDSIIAQLNIDMIGRGGSADMIREVSGQLVYGNPDHVDLIGSRRLSTELGDLIAEENQKQPAPLKLDYYLDGNGEAHQYYCRSDHYMYARYGIPIAFFFDGGHHDYHQVTDEPQYIDYPLYARIVQLVHDVAKRVADLDHRLVVDKPRPDPNATCVQ